MDARDASAPAAPGEGLRALPSWRRPREKLRMLGAEALSDRELLALILGSAVRGVSVLDAAASLLGAEGSFEGLVGSGLEDLSANRGVGEAGACRILAALEMGRRLSRQRPVQRPVLDHAGAVDAELGPLLRWERRESVWVLLLDVRHRLLARRQVSVGSLVASVIHPREVFRPAISLAAAAVILVHNHPSGDPTPSVEDHQVTARVREAGRLLGIPLVDHVILAAEGLRSFREEGWLQDA